VLIIIVTDLDVTQCLELSALQGEIDDPRTHDFIIPTRAKLLARKLQLKLLPALKTLEIPGSTPALVEEDWLQEKSRLTEVFELALQTAVKLLVSTNLYRCVFPVSGTPFEKRRMTQDLETASADAGTASIVEVTLLPGLQSCAANERDLTFKRFVVGADAWEGRTWEEWYMPIVSSR
jgi:hypothetical protein